MSYGVHPYSVRLDTLQAFETRHLDGYGIERLVESCGGEFLPNDAWSAMRSSWFDAVDEALAVCGSDVRLSNYFYRRLPFEYVPPVDFPGIGHVRNDELEGLAAKLAQTQVQGEEAAAVAQFAGWLDEARKRQSSLVFFYY
ncbi:MAG: DUF7691 family protein [Myxococcota bacterium]